MAIKEASEMVTYRLPISTVDRINEYAEVSGLTKTAVVRKALAKYLDEVLAAEAH